MIQIPDRSIILAPSSLHLNLYETIYQQKGNCLNIQINSIDTYIRSLIQKEAKTEIEILYAYKNALRDLPESNAFARSKQDLDFLRTCLRFMKQVKMYDVKIFPDTTKKEQNLKEILELLLPIDIDQPTIEDLSHCVFHPEKIYILKTELSLDEMYWANYLIEQGAHWLDNLGPKEAPQYLACANTRKEMEVCAQEILNEDLRAEDVYIALADPNDQEVLCQIFDAHHIPYTLLHPFSTTTIPEQFIACLSFVFEPSKDTYMTMIKTLFKEESIPVCDYLEQFDQVDLSAISYEDNALISEKQFFQWQQEEEQAKAWIDKHDQFRSWTIGDMESIAQYIQSLTSDPSQEDLDAFDTILKEYVSIMDQIKEKQDLSLFVQFLMRQSFTPTVRSLSGVLVGNRKEMSALRPKTFFLGAHAKLFPALATYSGIFDENYAAHTSLPPLKDRLLAQRTSIFSVLDQLPSLTIIVGQSDYSGKALETSAELDAWIGSRARFVNLADRSVASVPAFHLNANQARSLFFKNNQHSASFTKVNTFEQCPLRYYLRYGLSLERKRENKDISVNGQLLARILQKAKLLHEKNYAELSYPDVYDLVEKEFAFAKTIFPQKVGWFDSLICEYASRIHELIKTLDVFENRLHLSLLNKEYELDHGFQWENMNIEMKGSLEGYDPMKVSFLVMDPALEEAGIFDDKGGLGVFDLSLKQIASAQDAFKVSYRSTQPEAFMVSEKQKSEQVLMDRFVDGWMVQDLPETIQDEWLAKVAKKKPTYVQKEEALQEHVEQVLSQLAQGEILPIHEKSACVYCPYKLVCRNGAIPKEKGERN